VWFQNRRARIKLGKKRFSVTGTMYGPSGFNRPEDTHKSLISARRHSSYLPQTLTISLEHSSAQMSAVHTLISTPTHATSDITPTPVESPATAASPAWLAPFKDDEEKLATFTCLSLGIGSWRRVQLAMNDLVCGYALNKNIMRWIITEDGRQFKIEFPCAAIAGITFNDKVDVFTGELTFDLKQPPIFFMETKMKDTQTSSNNEDGTTTSGNTSSTWTQCRDFSEDQQATRVLRHHLRGPIDALRADIIALLNLRPDLRPLFKMCPTSTEAAFDLMRSASPVTVASPPTPPPSAAALFISSLSTRRQSCPSLQRTASLDSSLQQIPFPSPPATQRRHSIIISGSDMSMRSPIISPMPSPLRRESTDANSSSPSTTTEDDTMDEKESEWYMRQRTRRSESVPTIPNAFVRHFQNRSLLQQQLQHHSAFRRQAAMSASPSATIDPTMIHAPSSPALTPVDASVAVTDGFSVSSPVPSLASPAMPSPMSSPTLSTPLLLAQDARQGSAEDVILIEETAPFVLNLDEEERVVEDNGADEAEGEPYNVRAGEEERDIKGEEETNESENTALESSDAGTPALDPISDSVLGSTSPSSEGLSSEDTDHLQGDREVDNGDDESVPLFAKEVFEVSGGGALGAGLDFGINLDFGGGLFAADLDGMKMPSPTFRTQFLTDLASAELW
ncbi:hypothetical protein HK102_004950, partial [Quaeritorhiza haematococci]